MRQLWRRVFLTSGARLYVALAGLVTLIITARTLGPAGRGAVAAVTTWVGLFLTFGHLSLGTVAIHRATRLRGTDWFGPTFSALASVAAAVSVVAFAAAAATYVLSDAFANLEPAWLLIGFAALPFQVWELYGSSLLMALDRIELYNRMQVISRSAGLVLLCILLAAGHGVLGVLLVLTLTQAAASLGGLRMMWERAGRKLRVDAETLRDLFAGGSKLHLNAIGFYLTSSADVLILNYYRGAVETGQYQFATQLTFALLLIPQAAAAVLYGTLSRYGERDAWPYQRRMVVAMTALMALGALVVGVAAPLVVDLLGGARFAGAVPILRILLISVVGMTFGTVMGPQWIGRGLFLHSSVIMLVLGIGNVVASLLLTPRFGMYAPAWASVLTYSLFALVSVAMAVHCELEMRRRER